MGGADAVRFVVSLLWRLGLETLPSELQRNFNLMRDLDTRVQGLAKNIEKLSQTYMNNAKTLTAAERGEHLENIRKMFEKAKEYGDDKVQLAMQTYEMVSPKSAFVSVVGC